MVNKAPTRIAFLSDIHIDSRHTPRSFDDAVACFRRAVEVGVDHVVVGGDLFDKRSVIESDGPRLRGALQELGLWRSDRLTVIPGNHDLYDLALSDVEVRSFHSVAVGIAGGYDAAPFARWAAPLTDDGGPLRIPLMRRVGHVRLVGVDSVPKEISKFASGVWTTELDGVLRNWLSGTYGARNVLVMHHSPQPEPGTFASLRVPRNQDDIKEILKPRALFPEDFERLRGFLEALPIDVILCGHHHAHSTWSVGRAQVFREGRTQRDERGGPMFGILSVPPKGAVTYERVAMP